jgi:hypothetical protein
VPDCCVALGLGGHELLAAEFFQGNGLFRFSLAQAFLYVTLGRVELRKRRNIHAGQVHTELQQLEGCALATQFVHHFVSAVSGGFEPSREERTVTSHGHRRGCGQTIGLETCWLVVMRSGHGFVQRTENTEVRKQKRSESDDIHVMVGLHRKNLEGRD